jgi:ubiquinone/menaquinone biosynthesis C-methylase UbiE
VAAGHPAAPTPCGKIGQFAAAVHRRLASPYTFPAGAPAGAVAGPEGKVFAVDIQQEMLDLLQRNMARREVKNVVSVLGTTNDPKLPPASVDTMLMVDVYHEFDQPFEMLGAMVKGLKKGGRIVLVEFRAEDPAVNIKRVHKMSELQARTEFELFPELRWEKTISVLPQQHILIFRKTR